MLALSGKRDHSAILKVFGMTPSEFDLRFSDFQLSDEKCLIYKLLGAIPGNDAGIFCVTY